ncbi:PilW family protein [Microbulbifer bruguierae]|uniref:PilW family protein n=1 Tax=Microbulbifer bruguierae TaxID=3029061 RepID=A0ABY8NGY2_9GAMM|nr:PilW family protein [Microbulbifer bruguierae]WGL18195.1 PilW family protein [Microbulbifer bruguierae]
MKRNSLSGQHGLSLIELMIAMVLSAILLWGVLQIFDSNRDTIRMQNAFARVQESGRFAIDLLGKEIRMADYWGCAPDTASIRNHLDTNDPDYSEDVLGDLGAEGILGTDNASSLTIGSKTVTDGTDVLYLRGADDACGGTGRMVPSTQAAALHVSQNCNVQQGQTVLLSNCQSGELMTITNVQGGGGGSSNKLTVVHNLGSLADGLIENATKDLQRQYGGDARILVPYQRIFFISSSDVTAGSPALFISENGADAQELIPGVEDMQILYGRDTNGDNTADTWTNASGLTPEQMEDVQVLRLQLVVTSDMNVDTEELTVTDLDNTNTTYDDGKLRKVYLTTAKIRNRGSM